MTRTNRPTFFIDVYPFWGVKFIILAKTGSLYLFTTMYDPFDKAELVLDLRKPSQITSDGLIVHVKVYLPLNHTPLIYILFFLFLLSLFFFCRLGTSVCPLKLRVAMKQLAG